MALIGSGLIGFAWARRASSKPLRFKKRGIVNKIVGITLIVLGLAGLAWGGFTYTTQEKLVDIGPIHASVEKTHNVPLPPVAGAVALIGGVALLVTSGARRKA